MLAGLLFYIYRRHWNHRPYIEHRGELQSQNRHELSSGRRKRKPVKPLPAPVELAAAEVAAEKDAVVPPPPVYMS